MILKLYEEDNKNLTNMFPETGQLFENNPAGTEINEFTAMESHENKIETLISSLLDLLKEYRGNGHPSKNRNLDKI